MSANRTGRMSVTTVSAARESDMTLEERQATIAYERILDIGEKCQQIIKSGAFEILSNDRKRDFVIAEDALLRVKYEFQAFVSKHTDFGSEEGKTNDAH